jgi:hypothetical protein
MVVKKKLIPPQAGRIAILRYDFLAIRAYPGNDQLQTDRDPLRWGEDADWNSHAVQFSKIVLIIAK